MLAEWFLAEVAAMEGASQMIYRFGCAIKHLAKAGKGHSVGKAAPHVAMRPSCLPDVRDIVWAVVGVALSSRGASPPPAPRQHLQGLLLCNRT